MDIEDERQFREFVGARSKALLQTAYLLTGDWEHSRDLVQSALAGLARKWGQLADPGLAEAYTRKAIYHAHVDRTRRLSWRRERTTAIVPDRAIERSDPADQVAARRDLMGALRLLPRGSARWWSCGISRTGPTRTSQRCWGSRPARCAVEHHKALKALRVSASVDVQGWYDDGAGLAGGDGRGCRGPGG